MKTGVLKNFAHFVFFPMLESHFNKVAGHQPCNFISKGPQHRCFPVKLAKFLRTPILKNNCFYSEKFHKFQRKTSAPDSLFNKVAGLKACTFVENKLSSTGLFL